MPESTSNGHENAVIAGDTAGVKGLRMMPDFDDPLVEREYLKGRLALAFRIFAQKGFDEG